MHFLLLLPLQPLLQLFILQALQYQRPIASNPLYADVDPRFLADLHGPGRLELVDHPRAAEPELAGDERAQVVVVGVIRDDPYGCHRC